MTAAVPPIGPLNSTRDLQPGDVLRCVRDWEDLRDLFGPGPHVLRQASNNGAAIRIVGRSEWAAVSRFAFIGRPDADGWIPWHGGENPVPGRTVQVRYPTGPSYPAGPSSQVSWDKAEAFRIVATAAQVTTLDPRCNPPARCAITAAADDVREKVALLTVAVVKAQALGVSCRFDALPLPGTEGPETQIVSVRCTREA